MLLARRLKSLLQAVWSFLRHGDASLKTYSARREACRECPEMIATWSGLFCGACGCPKTPVSDLRTKWRMRDLKCPQGKW